MTRRLSLIRLESEISSPIRDIVAIDTLVDESSHQPWHKCVEASCRVADRLASCERLWSNPCGRISSLDLALDYTSGYLPTSLVASIVVWFSHLETGAAILSQGKCVMQIANLIRRLNAVLQDESPKTCCTTFHVSGNMTRWQNFALQFFGRPTALILYFR